MIALGGDWVCCSKFKPSIICMLVFGGKDYKTKIMDYEEAYRRVPVLGDVICDILKF